MKFYGRQDELKELRRIRELSKDGSRFTVVTGRRRVGKTELVDRAFGDGKGGYLYLLITRRTEKDLCEMLQGEVQKILARPVLGSATRFVQLFEAVMAYAVDVPLTLVIDEFQELDWIDPAIFGDIQGICQLAWIQTPLPLRGFLQARAAYRLCSRCILRTVDISDCLRQHT